MRKEAQKTDYALATLVAAVAAHLNHRWARYIGKAWVDVVQAYEANLVGEDFLAAMPDNPFAVRGDTDLAYDISAVLRAYAWRTTGYLDLVLRRNPEHFPVLLTEEAERALREGDALTFLTKHTYFNEVPGINSPGITRLPHALVWEHTTTTGRGHFRLESAPGRVDFRLRIERGGRNVGLTALEFYVALMGDHVIANHQATPIAEDRHREYAVALLLGIAQEIEHVPGAPEEALLIGQELAKLASSLAQ
jgi:hypothetical protein